MVYDEDRILFGIEFTCVKGVLVCGSLLAGVRIGLAFIGHKGGILYGLV